MYLPQCTSAHANACKIFTWALYLICTVHKAHVIYMHLHEKATAFALYVPCIWYMYVLYMCIWCVLLPCTFHECDSIVQLCNFYNLQQNKTTHRSAILHGIEKLVMRLHTNSTRYPTLFFTLHSSYLYIYTIYVHVLVRINSIRTYIHMYIRIIMCLLCMQNFTIHVNQ